jgi:PAS domain S-box-containing protein
MLKTLRYRLLAWFLVFVLLIIALILPANLFYRSREKKIDHVAQQINNLYITFLKDTKAVNDFLTTEPLNAEFFVTGESTYLTYHQNAENRISKELDNLIKLKGFGSFGIQDSLDKLSLDLSQYNALFDSLVYFVYKRGYQNFGLEGELYDYGELLENTYGPQKELIYQLRKIENDYFFNNDISSIDSFKKLIPLINQTIAVNSNLSVAVKADLSELVDSYTQAFLRLVELDKLTGIRKNIALKALLNKKATKIESSLALLSEKSIISQRALMRQLNVYYIFILILILCISVVFSYLSSKHIASRLEALTNYISLLSKNYPDQNHTINLNNSVSEIKQIYREFKNLLSQRKIWEKQRDKALQSAEYTKQRYQELADMLPQSIFETNTVGNYTYVNKAWYKAFGYRPTDLAEGLNLIETLISESDQDDILGQRKIENSSFIALRKDRTRFPASVYTDNIVKEGKIVGRRGIIIDITDKVNYIKALQQETSKAKTSDHLKSSFLANMSHEIRTPMNSIIGFSNLLASEQIPEIQKKDFIHYIRTSSEVLLNLVDDIIDIAKIEAGELKIIKKDCNVFSLGEELLKTSEEVKKKFNKQHLQLIFNPDKNLQELILKTDPFRLRQILVNLINNAIKFTDKGSVEFGFTVIEDRQIEFYVKDTGVGLSRDELDFIFERFKRTSWSEEKNIVGTGLGLAISKNLVQLLGGEMWVNSIPGSGTTFLFTLPYLRTTSILTDNVVHIDQDNEYNWHGKTILIVEDDLSSFKFLAALLKKTHADIIHANSGKRAIEICNSDKKVDLIMMDIQLPEMDGIEATKVIRKTLNVPVIAQTAFAMAGDKERMQQSGFDDYISKPIDIQQLLSTINHYLLISKTTATRNTSFILPDKQDTSR